MIEPFLLERFFAPHEFSARHVLCGSDAETCTVGELCALEPGLEGALFGTRLSYSPMEGIPELRGAVADLYTGLEAHEVVVLPGGGPPLELCFRALLRAGDAIVTVTPCYQSYLSIPRSLGCEVREVPLEERADGWYLDPERVGSALRPGAKLLLVNFPNNPTGYHPGRATFDALAGLARSAGARFMTDDVFRYLEHDPAQRLPSAVDTDPRGITIGAMSKAFGLPGLRIGWVGSRDPELLQALLHWNDYGAKDSSAPSQVLAAGALRQRARLLDRSLTLAREHLALLQGFFARHAALMSFHAPRAGLVGTPRLASGSADDLFEDLLRATGVLLAPGRLFGMPSEYFRIGFGHVDFAQGLSLFDAYLRGLPAGETAL